MIVFPPVNIDRFCIEENPRKDYFLVVSRLLPYKKIDIVIEACNLLNLPLKIVGVGPDLKRLKKMAGNSIEILGRVPDGQVEKLFANCRAFLFPGEEDFGIAPLESMAAGRPVIAFRAGGALETIIDGETGIFFDEQNADSIVNALKLFETFKFDPNILRNHALNYNFENFKKNLVFAIDHCLKLHADNMNHGKNENDE